MRIVAGEQRGRSLKSPPGLNTRPTADRTRQALFNILEHAAWSPGLAEARILDLFAGSGALGLEALSRGAASCLFLDNDPAAIATINLNASVLGVAGRCRIERRDAARLPPAPAADAGVDGGGDFAFAFLDPPYAKGLVGPALAGLLDGGWLADGAVVVVERGAAEPPLAAPGFEALDERAWGAATVSFLRRL